MATQLTDEEIFLALFRHPILMMGHDRTGSHCNRDYSPLASAQLHIPHCRLGPFQGGRYGPFDHRGSSSLISISSYNSNKKFCVFKVQKILKEALKMMSGEFHKKNLK